MTDKTYVRISIERQKLILGQIGNMRVNVDDLLRVVDGEDFPLFREYVEKLAEEVAYFEEYFPSIPDHFPF